MSTSDILGFFGEEIWDAVFDRIGSVTICTGKHSGNDLSVFLFLYLERKITFTSRTAEDFYDFSFHITLS